MTRNIGGGVGPHDHSEHGPVGAGVELAPKVVAGTVNGNHPDFATAQEAIDYTVANGHGDVKFAPGSYGPIVVDGRIGVIGTGHAITAVRFDGGTTSHGIELTSNANGAYLERVEGRSDPGAGNPYDGVHVQADWARIHMGKFGASDRHGLYVAGQEASVHQCYFLTQNMDNQGAYLATSGNKATLSGNNNIRTVTIDADGCVVAGNTNVNTVTNNGTGNVTGNNS